MSEVSANIIKDSAPLNLIEERDKFLANTTYNPQFIYRRHLSSEELSVWGKPKKAFFEHAKKMVLYWNEEGKHQSTPVESPVVTGDFIRQKIEEFNDAYKLEVPVEVRFTQNSVTRCSIDKNIITFLEPVRYTKMTLLGLLRHELETHYLRRHNHQLQSWGDFADQEFRQTEEGLANLHTFLFREEKLILKTYRMYMAVWLAQELSFSELYKTLISFDFNEDLAFRLTLRTKRGIEDTSQPGGLTKDISYFEGSVNVWQWIIDPQHDLKDLYLGRIGIQDIEKLKGQAVTEGLLYPKFLEDKKTYLDAVHAIGDRNHFPDLLASLKEKAGNQVSKPRLNASSRIMYEEAQKLGITCTTFGDNETILMEKDGKSWYVRGSRTSLQSSVGKTIADKKDLTKKVLQHFHLPTAKGFVIRQPEDTGKLSELSFPVVIKPLDERHGNGVHVGIQSLQQLEKIVSQTSLPLLAEEMLQGIEYRIVCVNFKFIAAAFRKPAHVVGDGIHTIEELIAQKNKHPWRGEGHQNNLSIIKVDETVTQLLQDQGHTLQTVLSNGVEALLRKTANLSTGGEAWDVTDSVHPENAALFEQIARACDLNVIGIDIMCDSLERPITLQPKAGVIEVNASPGLRMHHYPIQGEVKNIASSILDMVS